MQELIINRKEASTIYTMVENGIVIEKYEEIKEKSRIEGNIYIAKIEDVLPGMQAAFVDIGTNKNAFIHLKDMLPKQDEKMVNIDEMLKQNEIINIAKRNTNILVQVKRDATNQKGARVSTHLNLPSRFVVLLPNTKFITISQKIEDEKERERLIQIVKPILPPNVGVIIRTSAIGKTKEEIQKDMQRITKKWEEIQQKVKEYKDVKPILIEENLETLEKLVIDFIDQQLEKIIVNDKQIYNKTKNILNSIEETGKIELEYKEDVSNIYDIEEQLIKSNNRKIWLKCGGFITIDKTEALTAIDVNSGKYIGTKNLEQTVLKVNKEASIEIAKQLRLRNIGGIIVIDYIDMKEENSKNEIIKILEDNLKKDRAKTQIAGFTKMNLLEMTRKQL